MIEKCMLQSQHAFWLNVRVCIQKRNNWKGKKNVSKSARKLITGYYEKKVDKKIVRRKCVNKNYFNRNTLEK